MMTYKEYQWRVNDCLHSLDRLKFIQDDIEYIINSDAIDRNWTNKYIDKKLGGLYARELDSIEKLLNLINAKGFYEMPIKDIIWDIYENCEAICHIAYDAEEILTNENFHSENRLLSNEPRNIQSNLNQFNNELHF